MLTRYTVTSMLLERKVLKEEENLNLQTKIFSLETKKQTEERTETKR